VRAERATLVEEVSVMGSRDPATAGLGRPPMCESTARPAVTPYQRLRIGEVPCHNSFSAASVTSSTVTRVMQRKSIGHSRRKHGLHSTGCRMTMPGRLNGPVSSGDVEAENGDLWHVERPGKMHRPSIIRHHDAAASQYRAQFQSRWFCRQD